EGIRTFKSKPLLFKDFTSTVIFLVGNCKVALPKPVMDCIILFYKKWSKILKKYSVVSVQFSAEKEHFTIKLFFQCFHYFKNVLLRISNINSAINNINRTAQESIMFQNVLFKIGFG